MHARNANPLSRVWSRFFSIIARRGDSEPERQDRPTTSPQQNRAQQLIESAERIQRAYWSLENDLLQWVDKREGADLSPDEAFRLLHRTCLQIASGEGKSPDRVRRQTDDVASFQGAMWERAARCVQMATGPNSPYRPRRATVCYASRPGSAEGKLQGVLRNASCTHLGCLEVIRLDASISPIGVELVPFADLQQVVFAGAALHRSARLFFVNERTPETVLIPPLYGFTWLNNHPHELNGSYTRFERPDRDVDGSANLAIGFGQQDVVVESSEIALLGISALTRIVFESAA